MITHEEAKEALRILYFNIYEVDDEEYKRINKIANIVFDYISQQETLQAEHETLKKELARFMLVYKC